MLGYKAALQRERPGWAPGLGCSRKLTSQKPLLSAMERKSQEPAGPPNQVSIGLREGCLCSTPPPAPCRMFRRASVRVLSLYHAEVANLLEEEEQEAGFLFFLPVLFFFFFRNGILKQPATKANSQDNSLNNLHNARLERT